ncbi:MAG TPA: LPS export ABC transporter periplasmic protein LptC [Rhodocyclaceae bacterium]|nr:LPS export ABC transporter periplasmic protein LptC [Rhodocyclaceae bacterium]
MKSGGAPLFPLVLAGFLTALTFWLERASHLDDPDRGAKQRHDPDFYVEQFRVRRYDEAGTLLNTLVAQKMLHFPDDDSSEVLAPYLVYHRTPPTVVTAKTAWLDKDGQHVRLKDDVRVVKGGGDEKPDTVITTSVLNVVPDDEYAQTDAPVVVTQGKTVINGTGASVDNKAQVTVMRGPVHGIIYRNQHR